MENIEHDINENIQFEDTVLVKGREAIENHFFQIAKEHAELASQNYDRDDVPKMQIAMKHSIIAIVMSFAALEALSNDLYKRITGNDFDSEEFKSYDYPKKGLVGKWEKLANLAFNLKNPNQKELKLPNDFTDALDDLRKLRHQTIHYKPDSTDINSQRKTSKNQVVSQELELFSPEAANIAIQTVRMLLDNFEEITGYKIPKLD